MKLKLDEKGNVVVQDGKPVYDVDGKDVAFDAPATVQAIGRRNEEAKANRERAEAAEAKLKGFEGIEDPAAALKALGIVANLDQKKLVDAGELEKVKAEISKGWEAKLSAAEAARAKVEQQWHASEIGGGFSRSKYITEKLVIPPDMVQARFGSAFRIENGQIVANDASGNRIYSKANPNQPASLDEALETLVDQYPYRDNILRGPGSSGGGAQGSNGAKGTGQNVMKRSAWEQLPPAQQASHFTSGGTIAD